MSHTHRVLLCVRLTCGLIIFKVAFYISEMVKCKDSFLLMDYAFWSIFKIIVLSYMEAISGGHLSNFLNLQLIVPINRLYLWRFSIITLLSGNLAALNVPGLIIIMFKDQTISFKLWLCLIKKTKFIIWVANTYQIYIN